MKKTKILPLLLSAAFLASCGGGEGGVSDPTAALKAYADKGAEVTAKEATAGFLAKYDEAKFDKWSPESIKMTTYYALELKEEATHSVLPFTESNVTIVKESRIDSMDLGTETLETQEAIYMKSEATAAEIGKGDYGPAVTAQSGKTDVGSLVKTKEYITNNARYVVNEETKTYMTEAASAYDFKAGLVSTYSDFYIGNFAYVQSVLAAIPSAADEAAHKAVWAAFLGINLSLEGSTLNLYQNGNVITACGTVKSKVEDYESLTETKQQYVLDQRNPVTIYEVSKTTSAKETSTKVEGDVISSKGKQTLVMASWIDAGVSVSRPDLNGYICYTATK